MFAVGVTYIHTREIPGIIFDQKTFLQSACPGAQDTGPVADLVEVNAVLLYQSRNSGKKVEKEFIVISRMADRPLPVRDLLSPSLQRAPFQLGMDG